MLFASQQDFMLQILMKMKGSCVQCGNKFFTRLDRHKKRIHGSGVKDREALSHNAFSPLPNQEVIKMDEEHGSMTSDVLEEKNNSTLPNNIKDTTIPNVVFDVTPNATEQSSNQDKLCLDTYLKDVLGLSSQDCKKSHKNETKKKTKKKFWLKNGKKPLELGKYLQTLSISEFKKWIIKRRKAKDGVVFCKIADMLYWICCNHFDQKNVAKSKLIRRDLQDCDVSKLRTISGKIYSIILNQLVNLIIQNGYLVKKILTTYVKLNK